MTRKIILPIAATLGLLFALFMVGYGTRQPPVPAIQFPPPNPPYDHYVAGTGRVESSSEDISIGVFFSGIISDVYVKPGDKVLQNAPLFKLDTRELESKLQAARDKAAVTWVHYENKKTELSLYDNLSDKRAVSQNELNQRFFETDTALKEFQEAESNIQVIETDLKRSLIRAPINGQVLQVNVHPGESVEVNPFTDTPLIVFGDTERFHLRVEVDEDDAWRILKDEPAMAYVRGNSSIQPSLKFLYIEPYIVPKKTLTGDNDERVDTRVLQIIYEMERNGYPIYDGQVMDVYIKGLASDAKF